MKTRLTFLEENKGVTWKELGINPLLGQAYFYSLEAGNELPNFAEAIWENQIEEILMDCKRYHITEFTISSTFSDLITSIAKFEELGATLEGLVKINSTSKNWDTGEKEILPAFKMSL